MEEGVDMPGEETAYPFLKEDDGEIVLYAHIQPRAARDKVVGQHGDALKISLSAPPVDNKANAALIGFLSSIFDIPKSRIRLKSGEQSRIKRLAIKGLSLSQAQQIISSHLA